MLTVPSFERTVLVTDDPTLAAQISSLFARQGRYFPVLDGPRMKRPDARNEVTRRRNAMVMVDPQRVLLGGLASESINPMRQGWSGCSVSDNLDDHVAALRGRVRRPKEQLRWGPDNLGIGLYRARLGRQELCPDLESSPNDSLIEAGLHLLVACEGGDAMAEVTASNLAFSSGASFAVFPQLDEELRDDWLEELYGLGEGGDLTGRLIELKRRAREHIGSIDFSRFRNVLFVTGGFPWGLALQDMPTTHMYRYPDFGRAVVEGLTACHSTDRGSRTALLIDPQTVEGSEIPAVHLALLKNGTMSRLIKGPSARIARVQHLLELLPNDIVILSSHAGDAKGDRITYEYPDHEGKVRRFVVDHAIGFGYDPGDDKVLVMQHHRFHSLDGVNWRDRAGKAALPVGSAVKAWAELHDPIDRKKFIVAEEPLDRVIGSMAILLHDGVWLFNPQGFAPGSAPLFINNSCWSWHELSQRTTFAGARGYVGSLFPVTDVEAQEFGRRLFDTHIGKELPRAVWLTQNDVYGRGERRPYVMVGLPFVAIKPNLRSPVGAVEKAYLDGIEYWTRLAKNSSDETSRSNGARFARFLFEDLQVFRKTLKVGRGQ